MQNENEPTIPPVQVGSDAQESQRLIEEIQNTGVIESQDAAQNAPTTDEDVTDGTEPPTIPTPVITRG